MSFRQWVLGMALSALVTCCFHASARADEQKWKQHMDNAMSFCQEKQWPAAEAEFIAALSEETRYSTLENLGYNYRVESKTNDAINTWKRAIIVGSKEMGADNERVLSCAMELSKLLQAENRLDEAESVYKRIASSTNPSAFSLRIEAMERTSVLYRKEGRYADATTMLKSALDEERKAHWSTTDTAMTAKDLAMSYEAAGNLAAAEECYTDALSILDASKGQHDSTSANILNAYAGLMHKRHKDGESDALYQESLQLKTRLHPNGDPSIVLTLNDLAAFNMDRGLNEKAKEYYQMAIAMGDRVLKADDPDLRNMKDFYNDHFDK